MKIKLESDAEVETNCVRTVEAGNVMIGRNKMGRIETENQVLNKPAIKVKGLHMVRVFQKYTCTPWKILQRLSVFCLLIQFIYSQIIQRIMLGMVGNGF